MSYKQQYWNDYDENKSETQNIENGAVVTSERMNYIENGISQNDLKGTLLEKALLNTQTGLIGFYESPKELQSEYPKGKQGFAVVYHTENNVRVGYVYMYSGSAWYNTKQVWNGMAIPENAVGTREINFLVNNFRMNLFDGVYRKGAVRAGNQGFYLEGTTNEKYKLAVITIEPNTKYYLKRSLPSRLNFATSTKSILEGEVFDGSVTVNLSSNAENGISYEPMYTEFTTGPTDKYLYISMSIDGSEPFLAVSKTPPLNNEKYYFNQPRPTVDLQGKKGYTEFHNLFSGEREIGTGIQGAPPFSYIKRGQSSTHVAVIEPNTTYTLIREIPSRLNWGTATHALSIGDSLDGSIARNDSGYGESSDPQVITFKSGPNDRFIYVNNGIDGKNPNVKLIKGSDFDISRNNYYDKKLDDTYLPWLNTLIKSNILREKPNLRRMICEFDGQDLMKIFIPSKKNNRYVRYDYQYTSSTNANFFQWRVQKIYIVDNEFNVIFDLDHQTEWEGAIKEKNAADFMGGTHGDERNTNISLLLDGKEYDFHSGVFSVECEHIRIVNESILNRAEKKGEDLLHRFKISEWTLDQFTVENRYTALEDFLIEQSKIVLMSCRYENDGRILINKGRSDLDFKIESMSASGIGDLVLKKQGIRNFEIWGPNLYMSAEAIAEFDKYPNNYQMIQNFNETNPEKPEMQPRAKIYFDVTGEYSIKKNEQLRSKSIFKIIC